jgi:hypothetical protein
MQMTRIGSGAERTMQFLITERVSQFRRSAEPEVKCILYIELPMYMNVCERDALAQPSITLSVRNNLFQRRGTAKCQVWKRNALLQ